MAAVDLLLSANTGADEHALAWLQLQDRMPEAREAALRNGTPINREL
jgi:hypothetical protein